MTAAESLSVPPSRASARMSRPPLAPKDYTKGGLRTSAKAGIATAAAKTIGIVEVIATGIVIAGAGAEAGKAARAAARTATTGTTTAVAKAKATAAAAATAASPSKPLQAAAVVVAVQGFRAKAVAARPRAAAW